MAGVNKQRSLCTIFWPDIPSLASGASAQTLVIPSSTPTTDGNKDEGAPLTSFVIGWNPRGFVLCIADVVRARRVEDVTKAIESAKAFVRTKAAIPSGLRVVGMFRNPDAGVSPKVAPSGAASLFRPPSSSSIGSNEPSAEAAVFDNGARLMRQVADIWVELDAGPTVHELFCCGLKFFPQPHIVRFDPHRSFSTTPTHNCVLTRLGLSGLQGIRGGGRGSMVRLEPGAQSALEGVVLEPHVLALLRKKDHTTGAAAGSAGGGGAVAASERSGRAGGGAGDEAPGLRRNNNGSTTSLASSAAAAAPTSHFHGYRNDTTRHAHNASTDTLEQDSFDSATQSPAKDYVSYGADTEEEDDDFSGGITEGGNDDGSSSVATGGGDSAVRPSRRGRGGGSGPPGGKTLFNDADSANGSISRAAADERNASAAGKTDAIDPERLAAAPPRLDFPTRASSTELQQMLDCVNAGMEIRGYFTKWKVAKSAPQLPSCSSSSSSSVSSLSPRQDGIATGPVVAIASLMLTLTKVLLFSIEPFLHYSYTLRMADIRARQFVNFFALLGRQSDSCGLHPVIPHRWSTCDKWQRRSCLLGFVVRVAADVALGILVSAVLEAVRKPFLDSVLSIAWFGLYELHIGYLEWFLGWPGGFKMNDDLNRVLYGYTRLLLGWWKALVTFNNDWDWLGQSLLIVQSVRFFGFSFMLSIIADCCNVATLHLRNIFHTLALLYRGFSTVLGCLTNEFRGKKYNPLRNRVDLGDFTVDQMLIGTLIATATGFLFPTIALYYMYFAVVRTSVWLVQEALTAFAHVVSCLPVFELLRWVVFKGAIPHGISIAPFAASSAPGTSLSTTAAASGKSPLGSPTSPNSGIKGTFPAATSGSTQTASGHHSAFNLRLVITPMPLSFVFTELAAVATTVFSAFAPGKVANFIVHADHKPSVQAEKTVFPHLTADCVSPRLTLKVRT